MTKQASYRKINLTDITPDPNQPRRQFDTDSIGSLAGSMKAVGLIQPIMVTPIDDKADQTRAIRIENGREVKPSYMILDGARRFMAAQSLGWKQIAALVGGSDVEGDVKRREAQLIANLQREDLLPSELARGLNDAQATGSTVRDLEALLSISKSEIADRIKGLEAPVGCLYELDAGRINYQVAAVFASSKLTYDDRCRAWDMAKAESSRTDKPITRSMARAMVKAVIDAQTTPAGEAPAEDVPADVQEGTTQASQSVRAADTPTDTTPANDDEPATDHAPAGDFVSQGTQADIAAQQLRQVGLGVSQVLRDTQAAVMHLQGRMGKTWNQELLVDAIGDMASEQDPQGVVDSVNFLVRKLNAIANAAQAAHARRVVSEGEASKDSGEVCGEPGCDAEVWLPGDDGVSRCYNHSRAHVALQNGFGEGDAVTDEALKNLADHVNGQAV